jgi:hypothetical protein
MLQDLFGKEWIWAIIKGQRNQRLIDVYPIMQLAKQLHIRRTTEPPQQGQQQ